MPNKAQRGRSAEDLTQDEIDQIVTAVGELTVQHGFHAMTLSMVAERAGVPLQDVVRVGSKPELVIMACRESGVGNAEWSSLMREPQLSDALNNDDNDLALSSLVSFLADANPRRHALWLAARMAVNHDPRLAASLADISQSRRDLYLLVAGLFMARGIVPTTVGREELAAQLGAVISAEVYEFVHQVMGFDQQRYAAWLSTALPRLIDMWNIENSDATERP